MKFDVDGNPIPAAPAEKVAEVEEEPEVPTPVAEQVVDQVRCKPGHGPDGVPLL